MTAGTSWERAAAAILAAGLLALALWAAMQPWGLRWDFANVYDTGQRIRTGETQQIYNATSPVAGGEALGVMRFWCAWASSDSSLRHRASAVAEWLTMRAGGILRRYCRSSFSCCSPTSCGEHDVMVLFIPAMFVLARKPHFSPGAVRLIVTALVLCAFQNIFVTLTLDRLVRIDAVPEVLLVGLLKSGPSILVAVFLARYAGELAAAYPPVRPVIGGPAGKTLA